MLPLSIFATWPINSVLCSFLARFTADWTEYSADSIKYTIYVCSWTHGMTSICVIMALTLWPITHDLFDDISKCFIPFSAWWSCLMHSVSDINPGLWFVRWAVLEFHFNACFCCLNASPYCLIINAFSNSMNANLHLMSYKRGENYSSETTSLWQVLKLRQPALPIRFHMHLTQNES